MKTLKYGSNGSEVKTLQSLLNDSPQIDVNLVVDGDFGANTKKAVQLYQTANDLESDGIVGPMTWAKLQGEDLSVVKQPVDYKQNDSRWGSKLYTSTGNKNQTMANSACGPTAMADVVATFFDSEITPYDMAQLSVANGYRTVNSGTAWAFFNFMATQYAFSAYNKTTSHTTMIDALASGALVVASMGKGYWTKNGHFICLWKYENGYIYANDPISSIRTKQKFSDFKDERKCYFIFYPPIGWNDVNDDTEDTSTDDTFVDDDSSETIDDSNTDITQDTVSDNTDLSGLPYIEDAPVVEDPAMAEFVDIKRGEKGNHIVVLQNKLVALGYDVGGVDAVFGSKTQKALMAFQTAQGITASGVYDYVTSQAMPTALMALGKGDAYFGPTGIYDISKWQGKVDFKKVYESGKVGLFIVRAGFGQETLDTRFHGYIAEIQKYNIPFGVYWFSYAISEEGAKHEMESFYGIAAQYKPLFYVVDAERKRVDGSYLNIHSNMLRSFDPNIKIGLYVANQLFNMYTREGMDTLLWDFIWIPKYMTTPPVHLPCDLWQYGGDRVNGFSGRIDSNRIPESSRFDMNWYLEAK